MTTKGAYAVFSLFDLHDKLMDSVPEKKHVPTTKSEFDPVEISLMKTLGDASLTQACLDQNNRVIEQLQKYLANALETRSKNQAKMETSLREIQKHVVEYNQKYPETPLNPELRYDLLEKEFWLSRDTRDFEAQISKTREQFGRRYENIRTEHEKLVNPTTSIENQIVH